MDKANLLDAILAHACPTEHDGNRRVFVIESHCVAWRITATLDDGPIGADSTYTIISAEPYDC